MMTPNIDRASSENTNAQRVGDLESLIGRHRDPVLDLGFFRFFEVFENAYALNHGPITFLIMIITDAEKSIERNV
jgi:hypothetical protein